MDLNALDRHGLELIVKELRCRVMLGKDGLGPDTKGMYGSDWQGSPWIGKESIAESWNGEA